MSRKRAVVAGLFAGLIAALAMVTTMLLLASVRVATPLAIIGDRLSVFIPPGPFLSLMGRVGGYNHLKQLGVSSTIAGILVAGALGGALFVFYRRQRLGQPAPLLSIGYFVVLPLIAMLVILWPVLGTSYRGLPIQAGRLATLIGLCLSFAVF